MQLILAPFIKNLIKCPLGCDCLCTNEILFSLIASSADFSLRPAKSPLKVQNGVQEADSPVKKVGKRSRQILDSDDEEVPVVKEQIATKALPGDKGAPGIIEKVNVILPNQYAFLPVG